MIKVWPYILERDFQYLRYDRKRDVVDSFKNIGDSGKSIKMPGHALYFMLKDFKKWKINISYFEHIQQ